MNNCDPNSNDGDINKNDEYVIKAAQQELAHLDSETQERAIEAFKRGYSLASVKMLFDPDVGLSNITNDL